MARPKAEFEDMALAPMDRSPAPVSKILPPATRDALVRASNVEPGTAGGESFRRSQALDKAISDARFQHPKFFK